MLRLKKLCCRIIVHMKSLLEKFLLIWCNIKSFVKLRQTNMKRRNLVVCKDNWKLGPLELRFKSYFAKKVKYKAMQLKLEPLAPCDTQLKQNLSECSYSNSVRLAAGCLTHEKGTINKTNKSATNIPPQEFLVQTQEVQESI